MSDKPLIEITVQCDHCDWTSENSKPWKWFYRACPQCHARPIVGILDMLVYAVLLAIYLISVIAHRVFGTKANAEISLDTAPMRQHEMPDMRTAIHYDSPEELERAIRK